MNKILLEMKNITKTFPGVKALDKVNIQVAQGEIHALVGENGAGKSTLMKILSGIYPVHSYTGDVIYDGVSCIFHNIRDSEKKGIVIIHQELALVPYLSIAENMFLGNEQGRFLKINWAKTYARAEKFSKLAGLYESPKILIKDIGIGKQQLVEIAKALAKNVKLLILDEPTASLNETDSQNLLNLLLDLKKEGLTSIIISHKLNEVFYVADKITILRDGSVIKTFNTSSKECTEAMIINAMVGRNLSTRFPKRIPAIGKVCLEVKNWTVDHPVYTGKQVCKNINIKVHAGEIVGISGLMGAGRTEFAMSLFGKSYGKNIKGQIYIYNKKLNLNTVKDTIENGIAYITEDRKTSGLILSNTISENITLTKMSKVSKKNIIDQDMEYKAAQHYIENLRIKCFGPMQYIENLSGGNQQKVLISKWMFSEPEILILDEPTRGIDVGAKYEIYEIINQLVTDGKAVVMISSEMPEILGMCDRIYVMNEGKIVGEFLQSQASQETIMSCIIQSDKEGYIYV